MGAPMFVNWMPFNKYLKTSDLYTWKCPPDVSDCPARNAALACLPIYAMSASFTCAVLGGLLRDSLGSKACYLVANSLVLISFAIMYFNYQPATEAPTLDLFPLAFFLWGSSVEMVCISLMGIQDYFVEKRSSLLTLISCMRSLSILSPFALELAGPSLQSFLMAYPMLLATWMAYFLTSGYFAPDIFKQPGAPGSPASSPVAAVPLRTLMAVIGYFCSFILIFNYTVATLPMFYAGFPTVQRVISLVTPLSGIVGAPILGYLADTRSIMIPPLVQAITSALVLFLCLAPASLWDQLCLILLMLPYFACPCGQVYIIICNLFPAEVHGRTCGLVFFCGGLVSMLSTFAVRLTSQELTSGSIKATLSVHGIMVLALGISFANLVMKVGFRGQSLKALAMEGLTTPLTGKDEWISILEASK